MAPRGPEVVGSTRERVVALLRRSPMTVDELAIELGVTDNAVRQHITRLQRDGMVASHEVRRGGPGKPAVVYTADREADLQLSRAYAPVLTGLVAVLRQRLDKRELRAVLRATGQSIAQRHPVASGDLEARARTALRLLESLGGAGTLELRPSAVAIQGDGCPIAELVHEEPDACLAIESLLARSSGCDVASKCHHGARPRCRFEMSRA